MMSRLMARAHSIADAAKRRRLEDLGSLLRERGISAEVGSDSLVCRGRRLTQRWLSDPALRFIARSGS